jgi:hypothetical protein
MINSLYLETGQSGFSCQTPKGRNSQADNKIFAAKRPRGMAERQGKNLVFSAGVALKFDIREKLIGRFVQGDITID